MADSSKIRIGYLVSRYPAVSHTFILREVLTLRRHGIEIEVASINHPDRDRSALTLEEQSEAARSFYVKDAGAAGAGISLAWLLFRHPFRYFQGLWSAVRLGGTDVSRIIRCFFYFVEAAMLTRWMRKMGLRHLHVHFATPAATVALILARMAPVGFSLTVHGPDEFYDVPGYYLAEKIASAQFVCAIGLYARSQLMKLSPFEHWEKFEVSPLGVDPEQFAPRPFRHSPEPFEILCVGRLVPAKGQHILLLAASIVAAAGRNVLLRFVGDGPDRQSLEGQARALGLESMVRFEGAVNQDRIQAFYQTADVFALASFAEGIPVVLMEAMAMEVPCVTTWITGIPELIRNGVDGLLVAPSDAQGFAQAVLRLMEDAELRETLGKAGRRRVEQHYHLDNNVARLAGIFRRRLGEAA